MFADQTALIASFSPWLTNPKFHFTLNQYRIHYSGGYSYSREVPGNYGNKKFTLDTKHPAQKE